MLRGRFGVVTGRPYIDARIVAPSFGISGPITFLVDTGADQTVLMPLDGERLGLDYSTLATEVVSTGVGGTSHGFELPATVIFRDSSLHVYETTLIVMAPKAGLDEVPSLLGRNILNRWRLVLDYPKMVLTARVATSDLEIPLTIRG